MKLVTFKRGDEHRLGALTELEGHGIVLDLHRANPAIPMDIVEFLSMGERGMMLAQQALSENSPEARLVLEKWQLLAPIPKPHKIICVGLNYQDHVVESGLDMPEVPTIFTKFSNTVIGQEAPIILPKVSVQVDYEGELAFVIGSQARHVLEAGAMDYVAGYMALNDVSARDYQFRTSQWTIGKTFDTFAPTGPALITTDEIPNPHNLNLEVRLNGEVVQSSNTDQLIFNIPKLIAYLSTVMTLEPGDVISTGTPSGVGFARTPPRYLHPGDVVEVEIQAIGTLRNPVVAEEEQSS